MKELDGKVSVNSPQVILNRLSETEYNGKVGAGGAPISIIDVRGGLRLTARISPSLITPDESAPSFTEQ